MGNRYRVEEGIVIRRSELPNGDVVATLLSEGGKWRGIARKGRLPGGNVGRLSLFHDVTVQYYRKNDEDLALFTQVQLNGALPRLSDPDVYPYAHVLAELADRLTVDVHVGENLHAYLASGLRGLARHHDPEAVAILYAWRLLQAAGLGPRLRRCAVCGDGDVRATFDAAAGGLTCGGCATGVRISEDLAAELLRIVQGPAREALEASIGDRSAHWTILQRYVSFHVADMKSVLPLRILTERRRTMSGGTEPAATDEARPGRTRTGPALPPRPATDAMEASGETTEDPPDETSD